MNARSHLGAVLCVALYGTVAGPAFAVCVDYHDHAHFVGSVGVPVTTATRLEHEGDYAYLITGDQLTVVAVGDPTTPVALPPITVPEACEDILVEGGVLYLAGSASLRVYSLADPAAPTALPAVPLPGAPRRLAKHGSALLVAAGSGGLHVLECTDPAAPTLETTVPVIGLVEDVAFFGPAGRAIAASTLRVVVLEADDPAAPVVLSESVVSGNRVVVAGNDRAWIAAYRGSTYETDIWDLSIPAAPVRTATLDESFSAGVFDGPVGILTNTSAALPGSQVRTWNIESLTDPVRLGQIRPWGGSDLGRDGSLLYLSSVSDGLVVVDASDPTTTLATSDAYSPAILRMQQVGDRIHLTSRGGYCPNTKYHILDAADLDTFDPLGTLDLSNSADIFHTDGSIALATEITGLTVLDVSNDAAPVLKGSVSTFSKPVDLRLVGGYGYALTTFGSAQLRVIDVGDPMNPVQVASVPLPNPGVNALSDVPGYLLVTDDSVGLLVFDLANPVAPVLVPHGLAIGGTQAIEVEGGRAALKNTDTGDVTVVDLTDPTNPQVLDVLPTLPGNGAMAIREAVLYVAGDSGVYQRFFQVFDVAPVFQATGPAELVETVSYQGYRYWAVARVTSMLARPDGLVLGRYFSYDEYCGNSPGIAYDGLLTTFPLQCTATDVEPIVAGSPDDAWRISGSPNPFRGSTRLQFVMPQEGPASLVIHDAAGRRVRGFGSSVYARGPHEAVWDGRDDQGRAVSSGVYFLRLETAAGASTRRIVRIR